MPWCCEDETTPASEELLEWATQGSALHVPALWFWEILNVIAVTVKRQRISPERGREFLAQLSTFDIRIDPSPSTGDLARVQDLAERHGLTAYDTAYLDLAIRLSLSLATIDSGLRRAATAESVEVLGA
jgi:predicted nucleic acid-binding protein